MCRHARRNGSGRAAAALLTSPRIRVGYAMSPPRIRDARTLTPALGEFQAPRRYRRAQWRYQPDVRSPIDPIHVRDVRRRSTFGWPDAWRPARTARRCDWSFRGRTGHRRADAAASCSPLDAENVGGTRMSRIAHAAALPASRSGTPPPRRRRSSGFRIALRRRGERQAFDDEFTVS